jgi:hypothetical protein
MGVLHRIQEVTVVPVVSTATRRFRTLYGSSPLHLLALLASFAVAGYAAQKVSLADHPVRIAVWFVAAAVLHDAFLFPLYAVADRSMVLLVRRRPRASVPEGSLVPAVNHIRVPVLFSGLLLLVFAPSITQQGSDGSRFASTLDESPALDRWLLLSGIMFAVSAVIYAVRLGRAHVRTAAE